MSQVDLARGIGITPGGLSQVEKGSKGLAAVNIAKAAEVLGVPASVLMSSADLDDTSLDALVNFFKLLSNRNKSIHFDAISALIMADLKNID